MGEAWINGLMALAGIVTGGGVSEIRYRRRDKLQANIETSRLNSEDTHKLIDQLQEQLDAQGRQIDSLLNELTTLREMVRTLQIREIAWISHTSKQAQALASALLPIPDLPQELRSAI